MQAVLHSLAQRRPAPGRIALVVAHPDDETIAAGGSLHLLPDLLLVHVTDGAPRSLADAADAGFGSPAAYAAARRAELHAALHLSGCAPKLAELGVPDQDASLHMPAIAQDLARLFAHHGIQAAITHAYEGGHPDHDATALAVHLAASKAGLGGVVEFPGYHAGPKGELVTGRFLPGPAGVVIPLGPAEQARKRAMLDCFRTQARILSAFGTLQEMFRAADPDFRKPPHPGMLNYEHWGWSMSGTRWRALAATALSTREAPCAA